MLISASRILEIHLEMHFGISKFRNVRRFGRQRENGNVYWMKTNMAVFSAVADEAFVRNLVTRGVSHGEISDIYRSQYPHMRGLTERSVRRYCNERSIHRISNDELDLIVEQHILLYGHSYGRRMMQGSIRAQLGITSGAISQRRISEASNRVAPRAFQARTFDTLQRTNPIPYFAPYFGYKGHFDQNEKVAQTFGMTHVVFIDGCSRFVLGSVSMPIKNPILIYEHLFRPALIKYGLFDQIRMDHGREFVLCIFVQELLKRRRFSQRRLPWRQTPSTSNYVAERMWPEVNKRVNYPIKCQLCEIQRQEDVDFAHPVIMFCVSWVTMYVAQDATQHLISSWNHHRIPGPQGCVPVENMTQTSCAVHLPPEMIPSVSEAVRMYEERGGNLARDASFGTDPLVLRPDLIESRERLFFAAQPSGPSIFADVVHGEHQSLKMAILYFIEVTTYLARFLHE